MDRPQNLPRLLIFAFIASFCNVQASIEFIKEGNVDEFLHKNQVTALYFNPYGNEVDANFKSNFEVASQSLEEYNIHLGQVQCSENSQIKACKEAKEGVLYAYKNGEQKLTLFSVKILTNHAIFSTVLHLKLIKSVPVIKSLKERKELENNCKGKTDIVFVKLNTLLSEGHSLILKYSQTVSDFQVAITTEKKALKGLYIFNSHQEGEQDSSEDDDEENSDTGIEMTWFLRCKHVSNPDESCDDIFYEQSVGYSSFAEFIDRLKEPVFNEVTWCNTDKKLKTIGDIEFIDTNVFMVYDNKSKDKVQKIASSVAKNFIGVLEIFTLNKDNLPDEAFISLKVSPTKIVVPSIIFKDSDSPPIVSNNLANALKFLEKCLGEADDDKDSCKDFESSLCEFDVPLEGPLQQDDMIAKKVHDLNEPDLHHITILNETNYDSAQKNKKSALIMYYVKWDALSKASIHILSSISKKLSKMENLESSIMMIDCFDWNEVCEKDNVLSYPTFKLIGNGVQPKMYNGMIDTDEIIRSLFLNSVNVPVILKNANDFNNFKNGKYFKSQNLAPSYIIGMFENDDCQEYKDFLSQSKETRGKTLTGIIKGDKAKKLSSKYGKKLPLIVVHRPNDKFKAQSIYEIPKSFEDVKNLLLKSNKLTFDELKANNYHHYGLQNDSLVIFFMDVNQKDDKDKTKIGKVAADVEKFNFVWIDRMNDIALRTLQSYNLLDVEGNMLALLNRKEESFYIYKGKLEESKIKNWLENFPDSDTEKKTLKKKVWKPRVEPYNYLQMIEEENSLNTEKPNESTVEAALNVDSEPHKSKFPRTPRIHVHSEL